MTKKQLKEFFKKLEGPEGCNFREDDKGKMIWNCKAGEDKSHSVKILEEMGIPTQEIVSFLEKCSKRGGHCDCEIIFNAADKLLPDWQS